MPNQTILSKTYELLKYCTPLLGQLPRSYKFTYGDRVQNLLFTLLEVLLEAFYSPPSQKRAILQKANLTLEKLRYLVRLGFDLKLFSSDAYQKLATHLNEIGRMVGGWLKSLE
ncbi:MAG: diversity-generating retroelement protein Avd [Lewinellaceae bacterium]|nr:diversity-generating retroelement protein Avd [Lewinellaceae bacterium]